MITPKVMAEIAHWKVISQRDPSWIGMNPYDVTELAREQIEGRFATRDELNPVPLDEESRGHQFMGIQLDSVPRIPRGQLMINSEEYTL